MRGAPALLWLSISAAALPANLGTRLDALRGDSSSAGFAQASQARVFEFPRDHGPHPEFRHEWWYVTGHLDAAGGERFGFELTFFRYALAPPRDDAKPDAESAWRTNQIYLAHFAVTDLERKEFHFAERYSREALGLAGAQVMPLRVWLEDWSLSRLTPHPVPLPQGERAPFDRRAAEPISRSPLPLWERDRVRGAVSWKLRAATSRYALDFELRPLMQPVLNGEQGLSRKSAVPGAASYYYSIPRMAVRGRLIRDGRPLQVQGLAWLDREWGSGALGADQQGWDWFALQLDDGSALMFYSLRRNDGSRDPHSAGTWVTADGRTRPLKSEEFQLEVRKHWISPRGGTYPAAWHLRIPALELDLAVRPLLEDQELATTPRYWEGAVNVEGRQGERKARGRGYVELVGYAAGRL